MTSLLKDILGVNHRRSSYKNGRVYRKVTKGEWPIVIELAVVLVSYPRGFKGTLYCLSFYRVLLRLGALLNFLSTSLP